MVLFSLQAPRTVGSRLISVSHVIATRCNLSLAIRYTQDSLHRRLHSLCICLSILYGVGFILTRPVSALEQLTNTRGSVSLFRVHCTTVARQFCAERELRSLSNLQHCLEQGPSLPPFLAIERALTKIGFTAEIELKIISIPRPRNSHRLLSPYLCQAAPFTLSCPTQ